MTNPEKLATGYTRLRKTQHNKNWTSRYANKHKYHNVNKT